MKEGGQLPDCIYGRCTEINATFVACYQLPIHSQIFCLGPWEVGFDAHIWGMHRCDVMLQHTSGLFNCLLDAVGFTLIER